MMMRRSVYVLIVTLVASMDMFGQLSREHLSISDSMWQHIEQKAGFAKPFGFTEDEMRGYGPDEFVLRNVWTLFRNARTIPRYSGTVTKNLLDNIHDPAALIRTAYGCADISAGRMLSMPPPTSWGYSSLADSATSAEALRVVLQQLHSSSTGDNVREYPAHYQKLLARILIGIMESKPWVEAAFPKKEFEELSGLTAASSHDEWYRFAAAPWADDRLGQLATLNKGSLQALKSADRKYLAFASTLLATHIHLALGEFRTADSNYTERTSLKGTTFMTDLGMVRLLGTGADTVTTSCFLSIDFGGNDMYKGRQAVTSPLREPISVLIDVAGDDIYDTDTTLSLGCGLFGVAMLFDMRGNDRYRVKESGLGCAWYGTGLIMDYAGGDTYTVDKSWGQGAAHIGAGILADLGGNDEYICAEQSQGMGSTLGTGILVDATGNDRYVARDDGNPTPIYLDQSVAMAQGCGFGRRADLGDGHSLAGGVGILCDGKGNDYYSAQVWAQGCGYWWGLGICEDREGNDMYRSGKYSIGAAAHFAIGCKVDLLGDDSYTEGYKEAVNQYLGHARDGSIGISIDGEGNDNYLFKTHCGGAADLGSLALFWDNAGNDTYTALISGAPNAKDTWSDTPPFGAISGYTPFYTFRDDIQSYGIFLDSGGKDIYNLDLQAQPWKKPPTNNATWQFIRSVRERGIGIDMEKK